MTAAEPFEMPEELDDVLAGPEPDWDDEPEPPPDVKRADGMVYRLRTIGTARAREQKAAAVRAAQINDWLHRREAAHDRQEAWLRAALRRYHEAVLVLDPKRLSIALPSGELTSRAGQREWEVNEPVALRWAFSHAAEERLDAARERFLDELGEIIADDGLAVQRDAIKVTALPKVELSRSGLKSFGTRRDEKDRPVAWGVDPQGQPIPGVVVNEPERTFDVRFPEQDDDEPPYEGGIMEENR